MQRLDKILANSGIGTRTKVKRFIKSKRVFINGEPQTDPGYKVNPQTDLIEFNHQKVIFQDFLYIVLNKPKGYVCANKDNLHDTVFDLIGEYKHKDLFVVGRLDKDTTGLVIITNDGQWAHKMKTPKSNTDKEYTAILKDKITDTQAKKFTKHMVLDGKTLKPAKIINIKNNTCNVILQEGKFHQIKRMFHNVGNDIVELHRIRIDNIVLEDFNLEEGQYKEFVPK